ncbi:MAG: DUF2027 domain-containing protein, partial [Alloprevotella sp.]|nr:DUF2027 domain-containing protein [Alloprevotella sp.]
MKIGDKVRFLNEVGGGIIVGFRDKYTVLVEDETGFDVPMLASELVVVEDTDEYNIVRTPPSQPELRAGQQAGQPRPAAPAGGEEEPDAADRPVTFRPKPLERRGGESINLHLAFLRTPGEDGSTEADFEAYLINDSNYYVRFLLLAQEGNAMRLRHEGTAEPNMKIFLEEITRTELVGWERLTLQALCYKEGKSFLPKPPFSASLRIDGAKFYKPGAFRENDFFEEEALLYDAVRDDKVQTTLFVDAGSLQNALMEKKKLAERPTNQPARKPTRPDEPVVTDLHAAELLDTTAGMQPKDILDYQLKVFRDTMEEHRKHPGRKLVFIHGKGNGVLRNAILAELKRHYKSASSQDASFREYGFGAT